MSGLLGHSGLIMKPATPYAGVTASLLHFDGADAATTLVDVSGKAWTAGGNAQLSTADFKFGTASGLFDGSGDYWSTPSHDDFDFLTGNYSIECFVRAVLSNNISYRTLLNVDLGGALAFQLVDGKLSLGRSGIDIILQSPTTIPDNTWTHVAVSCVGGTTRLFVGGVVVASTSTPYSFAKGAVYIGGYPTYGNWLNGRMDELKIVKGAGYSEAFTPPAAPYVS